MYQSKSQLKEKGFSLLALLVAIAIIALLTSIGMVSFSRAQQNSRDTRRKADLRSISSALELFYDASNVYPTEANYDEVQQGPSPGIYPTYIKTMPDDPVTGRDYFYISRVTGYTNEQCYCLSSQMEISSNASTECTKAPAHSATYAYTISCP